MEIRDIMHGVIGAGQAEDAGCNTYTVAAPSSVRIRAQRARSAWYQYHTSNQDFFWCRDSSRAVLLYTHAERLFRTATHKARTQQKLTATAVDTIDSHLGPDSLPLLLVTYALSNARAARAAETDKHRTNTYPTILAPPTSMVIPVQPEHARHNPTVRATITSPGLDSPGHCRPTLRSSSQAG